MIPKLTLRTILLNCVLTLLTILLLVLVLPLSQELFLGWHPYDYDLYRGWGVSLLQGIPTYSYPLPTIFWIGIPLALLPPQFAIVWAAAPFGFILYLLRGRGIPLWLYFPLLEQAAYAQLDGWLILPLSFLLANRPKLAPLGAVLLLTKPTVAPFVILYMLWYWLTHRQWQQLKWFGGILVVYLVPAFLIDPSWVSKFIAQLPVRATESNMIPRGASLWTWVWHGGVTLWLLPVLLLLVLVAVIYLARCVENLSETANVLNMLFVPTLYASTFTLLIPNIRTLRESLVLVIVSWIAVLLDVLVGGWGGVYATIPLCALLLLVLRVRQTTLSPHAR